MTVVLLKAEEFPWANPIKDRCQKQSAARGLIEAML